VEVLGENYTLNGLVRCRSHHFTVALKADTQWVYIDDMCVSQSKRTPHFKIFYIIILVVGFSLFSERPQLELATIIHTNFAASQGPTQNLDDFPVCVLPRDPPSIENITSATITKSSTVALYAICFSVSKPCVYWKYWKYWKYWELLNVEVLYFLTPSNVC